MTPTLTLSDHLRELLADGALPEGTDVDRLARELHQRRLTLPDALSDEEQSLVRKFLAQYQVMQRFGGAQVYVLLNGEENDGTGLPQVPVADPVLFVMVQGEGATELHSYLQQAEDAGVPYTRIEQAAEYLSRQMLTERTQGGETLLRLLVGSERASELLGLIDVEWDEGPNEKNARA